MEEYVQCAAVNAVIKLSDSIRGREFIEQLSNYHHLKEGLSYKTDAQFQQS